MDGVIYMVVTQDQYELPLLVSENIDDIARFTGRSAGSIRSTLALYYAGKRKKCNLRRVPKDETAVSD